MVTIKVHLVTIKVHLVAIEVHLVTIEVHLVAIYVNMVAIYVNMVAIYINMVAMDVDLATRLLNKPGSVQQTVSKPTFDVWQKKTMKIIGCQNFISALFYVLKKYRQEPKQ